MHLKLHDVAADVGIYYRETEKMQKIFVNRSCENLIPENRQKCSLRVNLIINLFTLYFRINPNLVCTKRDLVSTTAS